MIRLRHLLERGRAHPVLGPVLIVVVVLLLAMVLVHGAHDGMDAAAEVGAICFALASFFGLAVMEMLRRRPHDVRTWTPAERAPPPMVRQPARLVSARIATTPSSIPLRR